MGVDLLSVAKSGLVASKKSLETTSHNIANVNTEGFSRQKVHQGTNAPVAEGALVQGSGVRLQGIKRIHDEHIEKRLRDNTSQDNFFHQKMDKLSQVEEIFNEVDNEGLNKILNKFFNAFRELGNQPENETIRSIVRETAKVVTKDFNRIYRMLQTIGQQIDHEFKQNVQEINHNLHALADLNMRIADLEGVHGETGDLRDKRDAVLRELSTHFEIHTYSDERNRYNLDVEGLGTLVSGTMVQELRANSAPKEKTTNGRMGAVEIFMANKTANPSSKAIKKGGFAGMFQVRNKHINHLMDKMDHLAYHFSNMVNAIHSRGFINRQFPTDAEGNPIVSGHDGKVTGIDFFKSPDRIEGAALNMDLSDDVKADLGNITTALSPNKPGDNRIALAVSKLQHEKVLAGGTTTLEEHYLDAIGQIGLETSKARLEYEQSQGILAQTKAIKERISGVSIDEEAANMIKYQQAYDASAKVIQTSDEMFASILRMMG